VAQSVKHPTLDFSSGHDLGVVRSSPVLGFALGMEPAWDSLSLSLFPSPSKRKERLPRMAPLSPAAPPGSENVQPSEQKAAGFTVSGGTGALRQPVRHGLCPQSVLGWGWRTQEQKNNT